MGNGICLCCLSCGEQHNFRIGEGDEHSSLGTVLRSLAQDDSHRVASIMKDFNVTDGQFGYRLLSCNTCHTLEERFTAMLSYDDSHGKYEFSTQFSCDRCKRPLVDFEEGSIESRNCPSCGKPAMKLDHVFEW